MKVFVGLVCIAIIMLIGVLFTQSIEQHNDDSEE